MKKIIFVLVIIALMPTFALGQALSPDYGTELDITTDFVFPDFDSMGEYDFPRINLDPAWSPDGRWLVFNASNRLWRVPTEGGNAEMMYEFIIEHEIKNFVEGSPYPVGFSFDGTEIIFTLDVYDESRGAEISISGTSESYLANFSASTSDLMAVNVTTGETRTLVRDANCGVISHDGRFVCVKNRNTETRPNGYLIVYDLATGDSWNLLDTDTLARAGIELSVYSAITPTFGHDDTYIICQYIASSGPDEWEIIENVVKQIPVNGGDLVPYTFYDGSAIGEYTLSGLDFSSDGIWTLYTSHNNTVSVSDTLSYEVEGGTGQYSFTHGIVMQCVYNNQTGDNYYLLPGNPNITTFMGKFSPDGSKYCYVLRDSYDRSSLFKIVVKDFHPSALEKIVTFTAVRSDKPEPFAVLNNYPNPFNPATTIEFTIPEADIITLAVYNMAGQKIRGLATGHMSRGTHSVLWDGKDDSGNAVSSGVYFSRLVSGGIVQSLPMTLVK